MTNLWARTILQSSALILDTETTGLGGLDEVIQVGVIDMSGAVLFDRLLCPLAPISAGAQAVHGLTRERLADAPKWPEIDNDLWRVVAGRPILIYNAAFDRRMLEQTARAWRRSAAWLLAMRTECVMKAWTVYNGRRKFMALTGGDHTAIGDCRATLAVIRKMAGEGGK